MAQKEQRTQTLSGYFLVISHLYSLCTCGTLKNKYCLICLSTCIPLPRTLGMEGDHPGGSGGYSNCPFYRQDWEMLTTSAFPLRSWSS